MGRTQAEAEGRLGYKCVKFVRRHAVPHYTTASHARHTQIHDVKRPAFGYVRDAHSYDMKCPQDPGEDVWQRCRRGGNCK